MKGDLFFCGLPWWFDWYTKHRAACDTQRIVNIQRMRGKTYGRECNIDREVN